MQQKKSEKKKIDWGMWASVAIYALVGVCCGAMMASLGGRYAEDGRALWEALLMSVLLMAFMYLSLLMHFVIHEAGHLVFGLLTGYGFSSFRIGSIMLVKGENGKLSLKKMRLAGTGGQCLMTPPDMVDGKMPYVLYNLGGCIANVALSLLSLGVMMLLSKDTEPYAMMLMFAVVGLAVAAINGIPMRIGTVDNDGRNALSVGKNPQSMYAFWLQMKINEQMARGVRLKEMPDVWFAVPDEKAMGNSMVATLGVFACNRLMDEHRFCAADALMQRILSVDSAVIGLHRSLLVCDRMYCELIGENRKQVIAALYTDEQKKFMKTMDTSPMVLRTQYVYELLFCRDAQKAEQTLAKFQKIGRMYPYPSEYRAEKELVAIARKRIKQQ